MAYEQLQQELEESKLEIQSLRERMSLGTPTVHKDLSLISLIPKWSGSCAFLIGSFSKKMAKWKRFCHACNLLCIIDEVFLFTQVTIIKKGSYMLMLYAEDIIRSNIKSNYAG